MWPLFNTRRWQHVRQTMGLAPSVLHDPHTHCQVARLPLATPLLYGESSLEIREKGSKLRVNAQTSLCLIIACFALCDLHYHHLCSVITQASVSWCTRVQDSGLPACTCVGSGCPDWSGELRRKQRKCVPVDYCFCVL